LNGEARHTPGWSLLRLDSHCAECRSYQGVRFRPRRFPLLPRRARRLYPLYIGLTDVLLVELSPFAPAARIGGVPLVAPCHVLHAYHSGQGLL